MQLGETFNNDVSFDEIEGRTMRSIRPGHFPLSVTGSDFNR